MHKIIELDSGLAVILEKIENVESIAISMAIPGGMSLDPADNIGAGLVLSELTSRGAGTLDSRALMEAFDSNGIRHGESAGSERFSYSAACLSEKLPAALELISLMVKNPTLPESEIDNITSVFLQDLRSLKDNPARRVMVELSQVLYPKPYDRPSPGTESGFKSLTRSILQSEWQSKFLPKGSVLSIAGKIDEQETLRLVEAFFSDWKGNAMDLPTFGPLNLGINKHIQEDAAQLQIALAYPSAKFADEDYYVAKLAAGILSGGMFGRLFTEVREKRGLCYSVYARHSSSKEAGAIVAYAGTTPERAHETLAVMRDVLKDLSKDISAEELQRAKADILSSLIIGEESVVSRAATNLSDWWLIKRIRSQDEVQAAIEAVQIKDIEKYCERYPSDNLTLVTLGAKQLSI